MTIKHVLAIAVVVAIAVRALVPAGYMIAPAPAGDGYMTVVICTSNGLQHITLDQHGVPVEQNDAELKDRCSFAVASAFVVPSPSLQFEIERTLARTAHRIAIAYAIAKRHREQRLARGPPLTG